MVCCCSPKDDTTGPTNAASPNPNISAASDGATGLDITQRESSGGPTETITTQPSPTQRPTLPSTRRPRAESYVGGTNQRDCTGQLKERTKPMHQGNFSDVSQAKLEGQVVAVKAFRVTDIEGTESRIWKQLASNIEVWAALVHPNVLQPLGFAIEDGIPCLISLWCDNGTLQMYLQKFPDANRRRLVREIADGLRYLHTREPPIIHGDLKMTNILVTVDSVAKISDFGTSGLVEQLRTGVTTSGSVATTARYSAPEILRDGQQSTMSSDVFSFAYVALETMSGKWPFWRIANSANISRVVLERQTPSQDDHPGLEDTLWELLRKCWNYEPAGRPHMIEVCKMLSRAGYGSSTGIYPPPRVAPSGTRVAQLSRGGGRSSSTV